MWLVNLDLGGVFLHFVDGSWFLHGAVKGLSFCLCQSHLRLFSFLLCIALVLVDLYPFEGNLEGTVDAISQTQALYYSLML